MTVPAWLTLGAWPSDSYPSRVQSLGHHSAYEYLALDDARLRRCLGVHEAGHAVIATAAGARVTLVTLAPDLGRGPDPGWTELDGHSGITRFDYRGPSGLLVRQLIAGQAAQLLWLHREGLYTRDRHNAIELLAIGDRRAAAEGIGGSGPLAVFGGHAPAEGMVSWAHEAGLTLLELDRRWPAVESVAQALDTAGRLSGAAVSDLIRRADPVEDGPACGAHEEAPGRAGYGAGTGPA